MGSTPGWPARPEDSTQASTVAAPACDKLMDQGGRAVVEKMRVVDEDEQRSLPGVVEEFVHVAAELIGVRLGADQVRVAVEERREGAERIGPGGLSSRDQGDRHPLFAAELDADRGQDRLADPRRPDDDGAATPADGRLQLRDLARSPDQWPTVEARRDPARPARCRHLSPSDVSPPEIEDTIFAHGQANCQECPEGQTSCRTVGSQG